MAGAEARYKEPVPYKLHGGMVKYGEWLPLGQIIGKKKLKRKK